MKSISPLPKAILFDFDGTLADTAPDLVEATQRLLDKHNKPRLSYEVLRQMCSSGARGLLGIAFNLKPDEIDNKTIFAPLQQHFLAEYRVCLTQNTRLFEGITELLVNLNQRKIIWGIITNKATDLTTPIVQAVLVDAGLPPATVVCGDTTPHAKPHPAPLFKACNDIALNPSECWYVGDDRRDITAAHAAGCVSVAVNYGYHSDNDPPQNWGATHLINTPLGLLKLF